MKDAPSKKALPPVLSIIVYVDDEEKQPELLTRLHAEISTDDHRIEIISVHSQSYNIMDAYREGFARASGDYVCFTEGAAYYSRGAISDFLAIAQKKHMIYCMQPLLLNVKGQIVDYFTTLMQNVIDLSIYSNMFNLCLGSYIFPRNMIMDSFFASGLTNESGLYGLIELLAEEKAYFYMKGSQYIFTNAIFDGYNYSEQFDPRWYTETIVNEFIPLLKKYENSKFVQFAVFYLVTVRFLCNWNTRDNGILHDSALSEFFDSLKQLLQLIDDDVIMTNAFFGPEQLDFNMRYLLLACKYPEGRARTKYFFSDNMLLSCYNDVLIYHKKNNVSIQAINFTDEGLIFDCKLASSVFLNAEDVLVYFKINDKKIVGTTNKIYSLTKYFGISAYRDYTFQVTVPLHLFRKNNTIMAYYSYRGHIYNLPFNFATVASRLSNRSAQRYWKFGDWLMTCKDKDRSRIEVSKISMRSAIKAELRLLAAYAGCCIKKRDKFAAGAFFLRLLYWITYPYFKNKYVWITYDQLFKGGDNGEYFFKYVSDNSERKDIFPYYIINDNAPEYAELKKKYGRKILPFRSVRCKLMALHATMIFATRVGVYRSFGIFSKLEQYVRDLCNAHIICLQHGLTIQRIAQYQNRLFDNTTGYFLVSPLEKANVMHEVYGYREDMLYSTGAPRYDGLDPKDKKQILIAPTWRRSVTVGTNNRGYMHEYNAHFKHTAYYAVYNELINDKRLISAAEKYGYKIIYVIHPILSPQINDFTGNDFVQIIPGSEIDYEKVLSESSLMITDYSGIQFDFAYMRKPVVYYHPESLPPQYDSSVYEYETQALGPVCTQHDDLVDTIVNYVQNSCRLEQKYSERIEHFFFFSDRNNCRRAYEAGLAYIEKHFKQGGRKNGCRQDKNPC